MIKLNRAAFVLPAILMCGCQSTSMSNVALPSSAMTQSAQFSSKVPVRTQKARYEFVAGCRDCADPTPKTPRAFIEPAVLAALTAPAREKVVEPVVEPVIAPVAVVSPTAPARAIKASSAIKALEVGKPVLLGAIFHDSGRAVANSRVLYERLMQSARNLDPRSQLVVTGFADATGSKKANEILAIRRANTLAQALIRAGIDPSRISIKANPFEADSGAASLNNDADMRRTTISVTQAAQTNTLGGSFSNSTFLQHR
jgi:outer membrane protein OmpA-like peptidoglycan-associated protein